MVKFGEVFQNWLSKQQNKDAIVQCTNKFFNGFDSLKSEELIRTFTPDVFRLHGETICFDTNRISIGPAGMPFFVFMSSLMFSFIGIVHPVYSFLPKQDYPRLEFVNGSSCEICSLCRRVIDLTKEKAENNICYRHSVMK